MNYNYSACCWFPTSSNILILPSQFWQIRFESYWLHCSKCRILVLFNTVLDLQRFNLHLFVLVFNLIFFFLSLPNLQKLFTLCLNLSESSPNDCLSSFSGSISRSLPSLISPSPVIGEDVYFIVGEYSCSYFRVSSSSFAWLYALLIRSRDDSTLLRMLCDCFGQKATPWLHTRENVRKKPVECLQMLAIFCFFFLPSAKEKNIWSSNEANYLHISFLTGRQKERKKSITEVSTVLLPCRVLLPCSRLHMPPPLGEHSPHIDRIVLLQSEK